MKLEVAVLGSQSLISLMVSVDVKQHRGLQSPVARRVWVTQGIRISAGQTLYDTLPPQPCHNGLRRKVAAICVFRSCSKGSKFATDNSNFIKRSFYNHALQMKPKSFESRRNIFSFFKPWLRLNSSNDFGLFVLA